ncbi:MAG: S1-C subfamily serine protease [Candidatus Azotimanducaceae bacterium]|jgi:S1-C subfamily serine protease
MPDIFTRFFFFICCLTLSTSSVGQEADTAQLLFSDNNKSIFQIRVMDNAANNKASTGTGFVLVQEGPTDLIATNYHVIASAIDAPENYRVEVLLENEEPMLARIVNVDVVNDLALLQIEKTGAKGLPIAEVAPKKGDTVYSIGFPFDLGITVISGTYNGLAPHSVNERVHFSGSLNPGMSGGPAFNANGEIIGVNVSTAGNQLSFLVPVESLSKLLASEPLESVEELSVRLVKQLHGNGGRLVSQLMGGDWGTVALGKAHALGEVTEFLRCWGNSKNTDDETDQQPYFATRSCQTDHNIFINNSLTTGKIELQFYWIEAEELNPIRFYSHYQRVFSAYYPANQGTEKDLTSWLCEENFVQVSSEKEGLTKSVFCVRSYKKFAGIFDVFYLQGSLDRNTEAYVTHFTMAGVPMKETLDFTEKFMRSALW